MTSSRIAFLLVLPLLLLAACGSPPDDTVDVIDLDEIPEDNFIYTIAPGDELEIDIQQDPDYADQTTVLPDGRAVFKYAGTLDVMNLTLEETRTLLKTALKDYYTDPRMTIKLLKINGPDPIVFLGNFGGKTDGRAVGQTNSGGVIPYRKGIGALEAVALAGGIGEPDIDVAPYMFIVRNIKSIKERKVYRYDLERALRGGQADLTLHPGDVLFLDQSWLQNLERAVSIFSRTLSAATSAANTALLVDVLSDGRFGE